MLNVYMHRQFFSWFCQRNIVFGMLFIRIPLMDFRPSETVLSLHIIHRTCIYAPLQLFCISFSSQKHLPAASVKLWTEQWAEARAKNSCSYFLSNYRIMNVFYAFIISAFWPRFGLFLVLLKYVISFVLFFCTSLIHPTTAESSEYFCTRQGSEMHWKA